jgi:hypothetical protein
VEYSKPEITMRASANSAIESQGMPKVTGQIDSRGVEFVVTNPAYEADE